MKSVRRSIIMPYPAASLYALVADVASYPSFLPGCTGAEVHESGDDEVVASLQMSQGVLHGSFTTRNQLSPPRAMKMELLGGAFRSLTGEWTFSELDGDGCEAELVVSYQLSSQIAENLIQSQVRRFCAELVAAFVDRARTLYG
jgi:ribosome-associated toxin RatA of RatAB toxin-antitoxin module